MIESAIIRKTGLSSRDICKIFSLKLVALIGRWTRTAFSDLR